MKTWSQVCGNIWESLGGTESLGGKRMLLSEEEEIKNLVSCPVCFSRLLWPGCLLFIFMLLIYFSEWLGGIELCKYMWFCWRRYVIRGRGASRCQKPRPGSVLPSAWLWVRKISSQCLLTYLPPRFLPAGQWTYSLKQWASH